MPTTLPRSASSATLLTQTSLITQWTAMPAPIRMRSRNQPTRLLQTGSSPTPSAMTRILSISAQKLPSLRPSQGVTIDTSNMPPPPARVLSPIQPPLRPAAASLTASSGVMMAKVRVEMKTLAMTATRLSIRPCMVGSAALPAVEDILQYPPGARGSDAATPSSNITKGNGFAVNDDDLNTNKPREQ